MKNLTLVSRIAGLADSHPPFVERSTLIESKAMLKKSILKFTQESHWLTALAIGIALWVGQLAAWANSTPFSRIIVFGDSVSDTGNFYRMSGDTYPPSLPVPPAKWGYWQGRFSNGRVWVEYLAEDLGMAGLEDNYAVGGATTGTDNFAYQGFGGVQDQIADYLSSHQGDPDALYILFAGHNDVFIALFTGDSTDYTQAVGNTKKNIKTLWDAGARHILVLNVLDVGKCPMLVSSPSSADSSRLVTTLNRDLAHALNELAAEGVPTIALDALTFFKTVIAHPTQFGFSDVTDQGMLANDPTGYLFWDGAHPTTQFHCEFAQFAVRYIPVTDHSDGHGHGGDGHGGDGHGGDGHGGDGHGGDGHGDDGHGDDGHGNDGHGGHHQD
jgi:thermolabile hemolysin